MTEGSGVSPSCLVTVAKSPQPIPLWQRQSLGHLRGLSHRDPSSCPMPWGKGVQPGVAGRMLLLLFLWSQAPCPRVTGRYDRRAYARAWPLNSRTTGIYSLPSFVSLHLSLLESVGLEGVCPARWVAGERAPSGTGLAYSAESGLLLPGQPQELICIISWQQANFLVGVFGRAGSRPEGKPRKQEMGGQGGNTPGQRGRRCSSRRGGGRRLGLGLRLRPEGQLET